MLCITELLCSTGFMNGEVGEWRCAVPREIVGVLPFRTGFECSSPVDVPWLDNSSRRTTCPHTTKCPRNNVAPCNNTQETVPTIQYGQLAYQLVPCRQGY